MMWWKKIALLKQQLNEAQAELQKEQGKASRVTGFLARLQSFRVSAAGQVPQREFADAFMDSMYALLAVDQAILFRGDPDTLDLWPLASRGVSPESLAQCRVVPGEGARGRAAQGMKTIFENGELLIPLRTQGRCVGLLSLTKAKGAAFHTEEQQLAVLFATQAALILESYGFCESLEHIHADAIHSLARAMDAKDPITHNHSERTKALVRSVAQEIPLPEILIRQIEYGGFLHDVGKIGIEDSILKKPGPLTTEEYATMKNHPEIGFRILQPIPFLRAASAIVLYHQEWYNGAGYPEGLAGEEIPLGARIVQIIDAWDAMTSNRPYRQAMPKSSAIAELRRQAGTQFDPKLVDLFLRVIDRLEREGVPTTEIRQTATIEN